MIKRFEEGKWYRWIGENKRGGGWSQMGLMDYVLDGKPHLVIRAHGSSGACFKDDYNNYPKMGKEDWTWSWGKSTDFFEEVNPVGQLTIGLD